MSTRPNTVKLSGMTIPGTHESCARIPPGFVQPFAACQDWTLAEQLDHGIRYVDIRCRHLVDDQSQQDVFAIHHQNLYLNLNFTDVRDACLAFVKAHPTECVIMQVKHEYTDGPGTTQTFAQVLDGYLQGFERYFYLDDHIPTLGEVRGKIVIVRRFNLDGVEGPRGLSPLTWQDNATFEVKYKATNGDHVTFEIQDKYSDVSPTYQYAPDTINKQDDMRSLLDQAQADGSDAWYINFASAVNDVNLVYPRDVAKQLNAILFNYLHDGPFRHRLGTLMMDFPDDALIEQILGVKT